MGKFAVALVLGLCGLVLETRADCKSELTGSVVTKCMQGLMVSMQAMDPEDPLSVCKDDVKRHMTCFKDLLQRCPEYSAKGGPFETLKPLLDEYHKNCEGSPGASPCPGFNVCTQNVTKLSRVPEAQPSGNSTPFSILPAAVFNLCTVFKIQMNCNDEYRTACPRVVNFAETAVSESLAKEPSIDLDLDKVKKLVKEECPKIPADFSGNKCVRKNLESPGFVSCILNVKKLSSKAPRSEQCRYYHEGKACIDNHIGRQCGSKNAKVIIDTAHLVIHDLPKACDMKVIPGGKIRGDMMVDDTPPPENGCSSVQLTLTLLLMLALAFILERL